MSDCIEWHGFRNGDGYGIRWDPERKQQLKAHRMAWEEVHGPIPAKMCVLHRCDNPPCINIDHLWLGTQADNIRDRDAKGRTGYAAAILTKADIPVIRERFANGERQRVLAAEYGVAIQTIGEITRGKNWARVPGNKQLVRPGRKQS